MLFKSSLNLFDFFWEFVSFEIDCPIYRVLNINPDGCDYSATIEFFENLILQKFQHIIQAIFAILWLKSVNGLIIEIHTHHFCEAAQGESPKNITKMNDLH